MAARQQKELSVELRTKSPVRKGIPCGEPLTVEEVKEFLGWQVIPKEDKKRPFLFKDLFGDKVVLKNRKANRPLRVSLAKKYALDIIRGKWRFNGESFVRDAKGQWQDGQHRMLGFVLAQQMLEKEPKKWREKYGTKGPLTLEALIVTGISPKSDTVDTLGIGQKRTLGDVLYRDGIMLKVVEGLTDKAHVALAKILAGATRLVWLRVIGKSVSDAPHFPHSEALEFLEAHEHLPEAVWHCYQIEAGEERRLSNYVSVAYAAGLMYLMGVSATDPDEFLEKGMDAVRLDNWDKADEFWTLFGEQLKFKSGDPIGVTKKLVGEMEAGSALGREEIVRTIIKGWELWFDGKKATPAKVQVEKAQIEETGKWVLVESPRIGGIDVEWEEEELEEVEEAATDAKAAKRHPTGWAIGDTCWVLEPDGNWFGTIEAFVGDTAHVRAKDDGKLYEAAVGDLLTENPDDEEDDDLPPSLGEGEDMDDEEEEAEEGASVDDEEEDGEWESEGEEDTEDEEGGTEEAVEEEGVVDGEEDTEEDGGDTGDEDEGEEGEDEGEEDGGDEVEVTECKACGGTGLSSKGKPCVPCGGTGYLEA